MTNKGETMIGYQLQYAGSKGSKILPRSMGSTEYGVYGELRLPSVWFRGTTQSISESDDKMDVTRTPARPTIAILVEERVFRFSLCLARGNVLLGTAT